MRTRITLFVAVLAMFIITPQALKAQDFSTSVGARLGSPLSASIKHFISDVDAIEAFVGYRGNRRYNWISINGAYQRHRSFGLSDEFAPLNWYYGAGAGVYFYSYDFGPLFMDDDYATAAIGLSGYLGLQYPFQSIPLEVTVDWVPTLFLGSGFNRGFGGGYGALAVRYILGR